MTNFRWFGIATMLLVIIAFTALGCNAEGHTPQPIMDVRLVSVRYLIRFWRIDIYDLQGQLAFQMDVELLDSAPSDPETPFLSVVEVTWASPKVDYSHIVDIGSPGPAFQYPLLRSSTSLPSFRVNIYDSNGEMVLAYDTQKGTDVLSGVSSMPENGIYLLRMWAKIPDDWVPTTGLKLVVLR